MYPYAKENLRQAFLNEAFYQKKCQFLEELHDEVLQIALGDPEGDYLSLVEDTYIYLMYQYTVGAKIEDLEPLFEEIVYWAKEFKSRDEPRAIDEDYTQIIFLCIRANEYLPNILGLCILFNRPDLMVTLEHCIYQGGPDDPAIDALINTILPSYVGTETKFSRGFGFRRELMKAINAKTNDMVLKHLKAYLSKWYAGQKGIHNIIIDTHLNQDPHYGGYYGYWAFEAAAVAYLKDIDDTELHEFIYYPKDIVQYARNKYPLCSKEGNVI